MSSGVVVDEQTVELYNRFKLRKTDFRFVIMYVDEEAGKIKVHDTIEKNTNISQEEEYKLFVDSLPQNVGRYIMADLNIPQKNGAMKDIMFLISWNPDGASTKSNILYTTSKKALLEKIRQGMTEVQANDLSDLEYKDLLEKGCK